MFKRPGKSGESSKAQWERLLVMMPTVWSSRLWNALLFWIPWSFTHRLRNIREAGDKCLLCKASVEQWQAATPHLAGVQEQSTPRGHVLQGTQNREKVREGPTAHTAPIKLSGTIFVFHNTVDYIISSSVNWNTLWNNIFVKGIQIFKQVFS